MPPPLRSLVAALVALLLGSLPALADHFRVDFRLDPTGDLVVGQVLAGPWTPGERVQSHGSVAGALWLRITAQGLVPGKSYALRIRPPHLDSVILFDPSMNPWDPAAVRRSGDTVRGADREYLGPSLGFFMRPRATTATYYLRIESSSPMAMSLELVSVAQLYRLDALRSAGQAFYLAWLGALVMWAATQYASRRDPVLPYFAATTLAYLLHGMGYLGLYAYLFPDIDGRIVNLATTTGVVSGMVANGLLHRQMLNLCDPAPFARRLLDAVAAGTPVLLALGALFGARTVIVMAAVCLFCMAIILIYATFALRGGSARLRFTMAWAYRILGLTMFCWVVPGFGTALIAPIWLYTPLFQGAVSGLLLMLVLRIRLLEADQADRSTRERVVLLERQSRLEQDNRRTLANLLDMLTHETGNLIGVLRMTVGDGQPLSERGRRRLLNTADGLMHMVERLRQQEGHDKEQALLRFAPCLPAALLHEVAGTSAAPSRLRLDLGPTGAVETDRDLLRTVLANLVDNALKHSPAGSEVTVMSRFETIAGAEGVSFDIGNAIDRNNPPDAGRLFRRGLPMVRTPRAEGEMPSQGHGLAMTRDLLGLLGGTLAYSIDRDRVVMVVWLPKRPVRERGEAALRLRASAPTLAAGLSGAD